jgi:hypothetical protein
MFVLPLIAATCFVAALNGNVLCIADGDHFAVEAAHKDACCPASADESGHGEPMPDGGRCSDVSADLDLLRSAGRTDMDTTSLSLPCLWATLVPGAGSADPSRRFLARSADAPPPSERERFVDSVILIL